MTPTPVIPRGLQADLEADWRTVLDHAAPLVRLELESDPALFAAFSTGWSACAARFIHAGMEDA